MPRKKQTRNRSSKTSSTIAITIVLLLLVSSLFAAVSRSGTDGSYTPTETPWLTFIDPQNVPVQAQQSIVRAAQLWTGVYGPCPQQVTVQSMELISEGDDYVLDQTVPGRIQIVPDQYVYDTALHAMTHACGGDLRPIMPVPFRDGDIIGFRGLGINVRLTDGELNYFMLVEEGAAERNAFCADPHFNPGTESYQRLLDLSLQLFPCGDDAVVRFLKTSDVKGLLAYVLRIPDNSVVMGDVTDLMDVYMYAYTGQ